MAAIARHLHDDSKRQSPQSLAHDLHDLLTQDRAAVAAVDATRAPVTMLHGNATATRVRKPRTARTKASDSPAANQIHGFVPHPAARGHEDAPRAAAPVATPITGQAPSLMRPAAEPVVSAPVQTVATPVRPAASVNTPVPVRTARRSVASLIARAPGFVMDAGNWARHVLLGSGLAFMERVPEVLNPVAFVFANLITIAIGLAYCALPAGMGLFLLSHSVALHDAFVVGGPMKVVYMALLYVTCGFVAMVGAFALRAFALGLVRTLNGFADKGKDAFADHA